MKPTIPLLAALALTLPVAGQDRPVPIPLWPAGAPGALGTEPTDIPTLSIYRPPTEKANGAAIVICPGGGYGALADHEGHPIALWLNSIGVTGVVLKYRLGPRYRHPAPLQDAQRAIRTIRARAHEWHVDPQRIGILGFSAGGHLASTASTHFDDGKPDASDPVERVSCRPDVSVLLYPVISFTAEFTHKGSRSNLLGPNPPPELAELLSNEKQVTERTPPAFLMHTFEDTGVPPENSLAYAAALRKAKVPFELHLYEKGRHGVGLAAGNKEVGSWPERCAAWLEGRGFLRKP